MDVARHDTDLALARLNDSGTVRSDQSGLVLGLHDRFHFDHVHGGDSLGDANHEVHFSLDGLENSVGSERRRHIDDGSLGSGGGLGFSAVLEDGEVEVGGSGLSLVNSSDDLSAIGDRLLGVEGALKDKTVYLRAFRSFPGRGPWCVG